jgi:TPR repeat protein
MNNDAKACSRRALPFLVALFIMPFPFVMTGRSADVSAQLAYKDSTSLQKIQDAALPAARAGNAIAIHVVRQTMLALGQETALEYFPSITGATAKDPTEREWLRAVSDRAEAGDPFALVVLGKLYADGVGVKTDEKKAMELWRKSAALGFGPAKLALGLARQSVGSEKADIDLTMRFYREAGEAGVPGGWLELGLMYANGTGVPQDYQKAILYFRQENLAAVTRKAGEERLLL